MRGLEAYKLDKAYSEGVDIILDDAPGVVFRVILPGQYNRRYSTALYSMMDWETTESGDIRQKGDLMTARNASEACFVEHCLVSIDGDPVPVDFADQYPAALAELMGKANDLVQDLEARVSDTVKKLPTSSHGRKNGQGGKSSTENYAPAAG